MRSLIVSLAIFLAGCGSDPVESVDENGSATDAAVVNQPKPAEGGPPDGGGDDAAGKDATAESTPSASDLTISEIALLQGVKITIAKAGQSVPPAYANPIPNRPGLMRVYVSPTAGFKSRTATAELTLRRADGSISILHAYAQISVASSDAVSASTFNFWLSASELQAPFNYKVRVLSDPNVAPAAGKTAEFPEGGEPFATISSMKASAKLLLKLVPYAYGADGSNRLPDTSAMQIERYRSAFMEQYPVTGVEVNVRASTTAKRQLTSSDSDWIAFLSDVVALRAQDKPADNVYYVGLVSPASSFSQYCKSTSGCTGGMCARISSSTDVTARACLVASWSTGDPTAVSTALHEVGHAHGRSHAPCKVMADNYLDTSYPYAGGSIGSWGYGVESKGLYPPTSYTDFMGYCSTTWISDYNYGAIHNRLLSVKPLTQSLELPAQYRFLFVGENGELSWGETLTLDSSPSNMPTTVRAIDATGAIRNITGYYYPTGHSEGGYMLIRTSDLAVKRVELDVQGATRALAVP